MSTSIADQLIEALCNAGVKRIYGIVGDSLNAVLDAVRRSGEIEWIHVRHEEVAAFAAGTDAALSGSIAVCAGSSGPGNTHLVNGLYDCQRNNVPVLAIAAHIPSDELGSDYFQQTRPEFLFQDCSYFCEVITNQDQMPRTVTMAMQTAVSKQGVSVVVLPGDVAALTSRTSVPANVISITEPIVRPSNDELEKLAGYLNQGNRITLLCGSGCAGAHEDLMTLCNKLQSPMVIALRGKEYLEYDNPYSVGLTGLIGYSSGYHAMMDCDVLLMLGTDFPYRQFYPTDATILQVDIRPDHLGRRAQLSYGVAGDIRNTIAALMPLLTASHDSAHLRRYVEHYRRVRKDLDALAIPGKAGRSPIHPQYLTKVISDTADEDAIFTCDVGTPTLWAARYLQMNGKRRLIGSFNHGTMANAMPQAIGAKFAVPDRQVVALSGDGGISMLLGDLLTLKQHQLPIKIIVFNNEALSFVELEMKAAGYLEIGTGLVKQNFADIAKAMGIDGTRVEDASNLKEAVSKAFKIDGPALIDVAVNRQELSLPPKITFKQAHGFTLWMTKSILNGRGNELIDLAKSNILR